MFIKIILLSLFYQCHSHNVHVDKLKTVFTWKQIGYDFDGVKYTQSTDSERKPNTVIFEQELQDSEKFFIQYNNVPIGLEIYKDIAFITVPRRRHGIPSTLNYVNLSQVSSSPLLKPYPGVESRKDIISVYRPRTDSCDRLWMVDTGLYEVPDARKQIQKPAILIYDLKTNERILKYELNDDVIINERTTGGLTSITVDITDSCEDAFAYINDLATNGLVVFSLRMKDSWRINHSSFKHDTRALNFTAAGQTITWQDGLFSVALSDPTDGKRTAFYHSLVTNEEFSIDTESLKTKNKGPFKPKLLGNRGPESQSGSHAYHSGTRTILFANVARDAILCWNVDKKHKPVNVPIIVRDTGKLAYVSDLKIVGDNVWVLVNQIPKFALSSLDPNENNFFVHRANIQELIEGTKCEQKKKH